jgi:hypothetical protein
MPTTYEPIATTTLGSAAATITFSSIPATYTDLRLVIVATATTAAPDIQLQFNGVTTTTYSRTSLIGTGSSAISNQASSQSYILLDYTGLSTTVPSLYEIDVFSYAGSTNKTLLAKTAEDRNGSGDIFTTVGLWRSTAAITSINLFLSAYNFATGTTATLYGIKNA